MELNNSSTKESNGLELFECKDGHKHSILIAKKCAYCMECGQILIEYKHKDEFKKWLHAFEEFASQ